jgi:hypothetical protein
MRSTRGLAVVFLASLAVEAGAATVAPPSDLGALARMSRAVVLARALESGGDDAPSALPYTVTRFQRLEQVSGEAVDAQFLVREPGGIHGAYGVAVGGAPAYEAGRTYLLFLDRARAGQWRSRMLAYGLLVEDEATGILAPLEEAGEVETLETRPFEPVGAYDRRLLVEHLREVARGRAWSRERAGWAPLWRAPNIPPPSQCRFLVRPADNLPVRWFGYETASETATIRHTTPGQVGIADGGVSAIQESVAAWTNHADSVIRYTYGGSAPSALDCNVGVELGAVSFNDPCGDIADLSGCSGTLAFGGASFQVATTTYDGDQWHRAVSPFTVVNNGTQCVGEVAFKEVMVHELGHSQGFGHHLEAPPPVPTMSAFLKNDGRGASIMGADRFCASYAYHTFLDVPSHLQSWRFIEAVENAGITGGCGSGNYCPGSSVTRQEIAVFLLKAKFGAAFTPAPCTVPPFSDVPITNGFCPWIRELAAQGITGGCTATTYCPGQLVTRAQMAVLLLRAREGGSYTPPACTVPTFTDVPCSNGFAPWIYELVRRGVTGGCATGQYCPGSPNTRAQMAIFLSTTFGLPLPPAQP